MTGLVDKSGRPLSSKMYENKKAPPPKTGPSYGAWAGEDVQYMSLPGGGAIQFDLSQLTLADYRQMRDHYQINSSLTLLTFLMHQMEWSIDVDGPAMQKDFYTEQIENIWTPMVRAKATSFWAGYSPNALEYENDISGRRVVIDKIKDLAPEDCRVRWKKVDGAENLKLSVYNGINQYGAPSIPVINSYWYPLLMEQGNYYGRKLLRPAFQSWFFSILLHLFANRYYERFGEPTPVGRAPYDDDIRYNGTEMRGNQAMEMILQSLRSRATVVLPNDKTPMGNESTVDYDYAIEYLESQMRGADFERYMTRLDEEMSIGLFTPILLMRTADVGSYNLGTQHSIIYQWMLNAIGGDWRQYINKYILRPLRDLNFGTNAPLPRIKFRRLGAQNQELINQLVQAQVAKGGIKADVNQLGEMSGLTLSEVQQITAPLPDPNAPPDSNAPPDQNTPDPATQGDKQKSGSGQTKKNIWAVAERISARVEDQVESAYRRSKLNENTQFSVGFQRQFEDCLIDSGHAYAFQQTKDFYAKISIVLAEMAYLGQANYTSSRVFMDRFRAAMFSEIDRLSDAA